MELRNRSSAESSSRSDAIKTLAHSTRLEIANDDATSPAACPPIPSATAMTRAEVSALSSLPFRTKPTAERDAVAKKKGAIKVSLFARVSFGSEHCAKPKIRLFRPSWHLY